VKPPRRVGIIGKETKPALELAAALLVWLRERGVETVLDEKLAAAGLAPQGVQRAALPDAVDLILVLGGDGTLLSVARLVGARGTPVLGINLGSLGFLTEVSVDEVYPSLERVLRGEGTSEPRMMLRVEVQRRGEAPVVHHVLNDIVINKGALARIIELDTTVDGGRVTTFRADGLIVCTPTGSTAYNLSAGGPMIHPLVECMTLTPICPFTLTNRTIVLPADSKLAIELAADSQDCFLTLDGQVGFGINAGDRVEVARAAFQFNLLRSLTRSYYEIARTKLKWGS
jgi:NAD+ kinase